MDIYYWSNDESAYRYKESLKFRPDNLRMKKDMKSHFSGPVKY